MWQCMPVWRLFFLHSVGAHIFIWRVVLLFFRFTVSLFGCLYPLCSIDWAFFYFYCPKQKICYSNSANVVCANNLFRNEFFFFIHLFFKFLIGHDFLMRPKAHTIFCFPSNFIYLQLIVQLIFMSFSCYLITIFYLLKYDFNGFNSSVEHETTTHIHYMHKQWWTWL